ncbi:hypothetical protein C8F04DRAFT_1249496 [Mycena alexandri]|uniref:Uncharacterized protein n=1 Tax=Mycena alexandri TaxID=1745969 RepID=A0AAD6XCN1_9AGAR|nr:hypothetical protein C8F04DRAFT_1249496 [Mycena alexandri]
MGAIPVRTGAPKTERVPSLQPLSFDLGLDVAFDSPQATPTAATYAASGSGPSPSLPVLAGHPAHNQHYLRAPHAQFVRACADVLPLPGLDGAFDSPQVTPTAATYAASGSGPSPVTPLAGHPPAHTSTISHLALNSSALRLARRAEPLHHRQNHPLTTMTPPTRVGTHLGRTPSDARTRAPPRTHPARPRRARHDPQLPDRAQDSYLTLSQPLATFLLHFVAAWSRKTPQPTLWPDFQVLPGFM